MNPVAKIYLASGERNTCSICKRLQRSRLRPLSRISFACGGAKSGLVNPLGLKLDVCAIVRLTDQLRPYVPAEVGGADSTGIDRYPR